MSNSIIQVANISKSYTITHEGKESYTALRDIMARQVKKIFSFKGRNSTTVVTKEEFWALKDVSFEIEQGDRVGIIGRNGAGKSTLLKILSRITEPTTGKIKIKGRIASLLEVGTGFHPELTGRENIYLNGAILGMSRVEIKKHFDAIVDFAEIEKFLDTPVKRYSSGMYVRLAFAVAAHLDPEILIVDEVLAVGDAQFQKKCLGKMEDVSKSEGRTVIFVSHNMPSIKALCTKAINLKNGQIHFQGEVLAVIEKYFESTVKVDQSGVIPDNFERYNTGEAKFTSIMLVDSNNESIQEICLRETLIFRIKLNVFQKIKDVLFDLKICSPDGIVITHSMNVVDGAGFFTFEKGKHAVMLEIENNLQPGNYSVTLGVHNSSFGTATIDYVENVYNFSVIQITKDQTQSDYNFKFIYGYVSPKTKWVVINNN